MSCRGEVRDNRGHKFHLRGKETAPGRIYLLKDLILIQVGVRKKADRPSAQRGATGLRTAHLSVLQKNIGLGRSPYQRQRGGRKKRLMQKEK